MLRLTQLGRAYADGESDVWRADWQRFDVLAGRSVEVTSANERFAGHAMGVDESGSLLVGAGDQTRRFVSGDVSVRES